MKKYKNDNPEFSNEIDIVEVTDPNHADNINKADKQTFENTLINKDNIEQLENNKVDKVDGKGLSTNDYTTAEKNKLSGIAEKANNYVHPVSHPADMIEQDTTHRFVSDNEKTSWNAAYRQSTGYTDKKIADLINGAPETLDTLKEVADAIKANKTVADALTAAVGKKANQAELDTHVSNNTIHITSQERTKWNKVTDKLDKTGGAISGDIVPDKTEAYDLGHEDKKWDNVWVNCVEADVLKGELYGNADTASGIKPIDITGKTIDINSYTLNSGNYNNALYVNKTDGGANNIKNIPVSDRPFKLYVDLVRWASTTDYITKQTFLSSNSGTATTYERWCVNGKWTAWLPNARFTACPTGGQVLIADGASGGIKTSGYTIASSVPANAKFTDTNTWIAFKGATTSAAGTAGYAPAPAAGAANRYLRSDGTWSVPPDNNTTYSLATQSMNGLQSAADKKKLDGIAAGANAYSHPTSAGNKHIPSGGSSGQILRWSSDGTAVWGSDNNTTYSNFVKSGTGAKAGLVPAPSTTAGTTKYLREDGTWQVPPDTNNKASAISKTTNGNNIKGTYRCVTLSDGSTKILYGKTTLAQINLKEPYGNAYWADVYIDLPSHINNIENITITPRVPATGLMSVQIMGYTSAYIAIRAFGPKAEAIAYQFMVCVMGY